MKAGMVKYPLVLTSAIFFWMPVTYALLLVFPYSGPFLLTAILITMCTLSIAGTLLILLGRFTKPLQRYFIFPLILDLLAILMFGVFLFRIGGSISRGIPGSGWIGLAAGILLLAPCSIALFYAIPAASRARSVSIALTAIMCIPAATALVILIQDFLHNTFDSALGLMAVYWIVCMPIIGICYLAMAWYANDS
mgnify:FL=1